MKGRLPDDEDEPAPFVRIRTTRQLFSKSLATAGYEAGCQGKMAYSSASAAAKALRRKPDIDGRRVYHCRHCGKYHIGAQAERWTTRP